MTELIPREMEKRWRKDATGRAISKLNNLLELRDLHIENMVGGKPRNPIGLINRDAARIMMLSRNTIERYLRIIRAYPDEKLKYWVDNGICFDHMEAANFYQTADKTAAWLLDRAIDPGSADGSPMTVEELITFSNGEKKYDGLLARFRGWWARIGESPYRFGWDADKAERFTEWHNAGREFFDA